MCSKLTLRLGRVFATVLNVFEPDPVDRFDVPDGAPQHPFLDWEPNSDAVANHHLGSAFRRRFGLAFWLGGEQLACIGMLGPLEDGLGAGRVVPQDALGRSGAGVGRQLWQR